MAKKTMKTVEEKVEDVNDEETAIPKEPKTPKGKRVVGIYDGQQIDRVYEDAELAQQFCDKINNSGRNGNNAKVI